VSLQAAGHLGPWLAVAVADGGDRRAREEVAMGALLGGIAFGSTGTHLCHALQYPIGALTKTPHGLGTGLLLPYMLSVIQSESGVAERIAALGAALEGVGSSSADRTIARIVELNRAIGVPSTLADLGIDRGRLPDLADLALGSKRLIAIAPVEPSKDVLMEILERAYDGVLT
jgi:alcohol dehydrogenase class IV